MYIFANEGVGMSAPKLAAQTAHAAVEAYHAQLFSGDSEASELIDAWRLGGHYTKIILSARDEQHLINIERYLNDRGFHTELIIDEGRTEIEAHTRTALGCWVVDKDDPHTKATFGEFKTMREKKPQTSEQRIEVEVPKPDPNIFTFPRGGTYTNASDCFGFASPFFDADDADSDWDPNL